MISGVEMKPGNFQLKPGDVSKFFRVIYDVLADVIRRRFDEVTIESTAVSMLAISGANPARNGTVAGVFIGTSILPADLF